MGDKTYSRRGRPTLGHSQALALYDALISACTGVRREGDHMPFTAVGGHMFSFLKPDGSMGLRLPEPRREAFLEEHGTSLAEREGAVLDEYVEVPPELLECTETIAADFAAAYEYVASLKPRHN